MLVPLSSLRFSTMEVIWAEFYDYASDFFNKPALMETFVDILVCALPIWVAVMIGLVIGWSWRPRWTGWVFLGCRSNLRFVWTAPPGLGARRFWFAFTALSAFSVCRRLWCNFRSRSGKVDVVESAPIARAKESDVVEFDDIDRPMTEPSDEELNNVTEKDLEHLVNLLDVNDGEMAWQSMMERSTSNMTYQAWRHEPEMGPVVYRSKTIFEDATPEIVRDFFWDDELRPKWDPMLAHFKILEECPDTGMMIVHWIKKFPFFCSDREYIIGKRIWEAGKTYYCLTKGVPYPTLARHDKPRRVDLYFSSWVIKPVQSRKGDVQLSACEVTLVHYEDMGIPKDVAKLGVRHGMWGTVKKLHSGFRAYQSAQRLESSSLTRCAQMAKITTKISNGEGTELTEHISTEEEKNEVVAAEKQKDRGGIDWKLLAVGGTIALVCGLQTGVLGKALLIGAGHRFARRRANPS